ncbi:MAG: hypothetical protein OMM_02910 [Candidatus Magnetoglobus multicellularis str. Araruama]|uniref:Uncharacterized protein n=1 Tax=Candidatus Magnetoglobus multicellularis str. Araruama TaxID=890399 RepID=A0A1V1P7K1_9BACT|nr:MAG: hypothetical protein OMM_02910 [Candidatus Magnetoglobus multicellularis str. Araruama]
MKFTCAIGTFGSIMDVQIHNDLAFVANINEGIATFPIPTYPKINQITQQNRIDLTIPAPKYPGNYKLRIYDDTVDLFDFSDVFLALEEIRHTSVEIPLTFKSPFQLSRIPDQAISPEIEEAKFSLAINPTLSQTAMENYTAFGHSGIQTRIPDKNITVSISDKNTLVKIKPERHQYGSTPIHITVSDQHASLIETFNLTVKFPQICFQYDGIATDSNRIDFTKIIKPQISMVLFIKLIKTLIVF